MKPAGPERAASRDNNQDHNRHNGQQYVTFRLGSRRTGTRHSRTILARTGRVNPPACSSPSRPDRARPGQQSLRSCNYQRLRSPGLSAA